MRPPFTHPAVQKPMTSKTSKGSGKNDVVSSFRCLEYA